MAEKKTPEDIIKEYMKKIGKKGGAVSSDAKKKSSADNLAKARAAGKKGGRPKGSKNSKKDKEE